MVSARILGAFGAGLLAMAGTARASSIVAPDVPTSAHSIIRLTAIEPGELSMASTPSIVALGDPAPVVTDETVAAIPEEPENGHAQATMIIRGGVVGGAFATPAAPAKAPEATAPANGKTPATPPNGTASTPPNGNSKTASASSKPQPQPASRKPAKLPPAGKPM